MEALAAKWLARSMQQNSGLVAAVAGRAWRRAGRVERAAGLVAVVVMARAERERVGMERVGMEKRSTNRRNKKALTQKALA